MATNMNRIWKILLYITGAIVVLFVLYVAWYMTTDEYAVYRAMRLEGGKLRKDIERANTGVSYLFDENGAIVPEMASDGIVDLKINGSDQPLRGKAPLSFTLSWKIDPKVDLSSCQLYGPNSKDWNSGDIWLNGGYGEIKTYEGSFRFENVMPGEYKTLEETPIYNGFASFFYTGKLNADERLKTYGDPYLVDFYANTIYTNRIEMSCDDPTGVSTWDMVDIWIDR